MAFSLSSPHFAPSGSMPARFTCEGEDISPELRWSEAPSGTRAFALIMDDPDAPDPRAPQRVWVHWVVYNIPASETGLPDGASPRRLPSKASEGLNDWKRGGYGGPCPPVGRHRYFFKLYALDTELDGLERPTKGDLERAMDGHVLGQAELVGTYEKQR